MRKIIFALFVLSTFHGFCELPILKTGFRKAPLDTVVQHANQNNSEAQVELALRYYAGHQIKQNFQEAAKWMTTAAEAGSLDAQILLSRMYSEGIGVKADSSKSEAWLAKALVQDPGNAELQERYKICLAAKKEKPEAEQKFIKLCADAGYMPAYEQYWLSMATDLYGREDYQGAVKIFQQMTDRNNPAGMYYLAKMYSEGKGGLPEDHIEAFDLFSKAAGGNYSAAQYELALMYASGRGPGKDLVAARMWYEKAAENGHADAQFQCAESAFTEAARWAEQAVIDADDELLRSEDVSKYRRNLEQSVTWYRKAAGQNHAEAQYMLGRLFASGEGVGQDFQASVSYYKKASDKGVADALFYLGLMYQAGLGVSEDTAKAIALYEQAAEQGSRAAMFYLGNCYYYGNGVNQNARKGELYYRNKALNGVQVMSASASNVSGLMRNVWVLRTAKEYGILLWRNSSSDAESAEAEKWMGLAARGGDPEASKMLVQMLACAASPQQKTNNDITGHPADPRSDAVAKRRDPDLIDSYVLEDIKDIYPGFQATRIIISAKPQVNAQSITGGKLWSLSVKYKCLTPLRTVGLKGVLLMGVELRDLVTGEDHWAFNESRDPNAAFTGGAFTDVSMCLDLSHYPNLRIRNWAVVYGHLLDENQVVAVLDEQGRVASAGAFSRMISRNRFSNRFPSTVVSTMNITGTEQSSLISTEDNTNSVKSKEDESSLLDSLGNIGSGN